MDTEAEIRSVESELAEVCGRLNAEHAHLVTLVGRALDGELWAQDGVVSPAHWLAWKTGLSPARAKQIVTIAARRRELPVTIHTFERGELAVDQVAVVATRTPAWADERVCEFARYATVSQLQRSLRSSVFEPDEAEQVAATTDPCRDPDQRGEPTPRCSTSHGDDGRFRLSASGPADEGAIIDSALREARDALYQAGDRDVTWWDALIEVCQRSLDTITSPSRRDRYKISLHVPVDGGRPATDAAGWALPDAIRDYLTCDAEMQPVWEREHTPIGVGRRTRTIPARLRRHIEHRDRGCRVPGCTQARWLDIHHIVHWSPPHRGATEPENLVSLCGRHHRMHHHGTIGITGNAERPDGLTFTNRHGRPISAAPRPRPPGDPATDPPPEPAGHYRHPTGERLDTWSVAFFRPRPRPEPGAAPEPQPEPEPSAGPESQPDPGARHELPADEPLADEPRVAAEPRPGGGTEAGAAA